MTPEEKLADALAEFSSTIEQGRATLRKLRVILHVPEDEPIYSDAWKAELEEDPKNER